MNAISVIISAVIAVLFILAVRYCVRHGSSCAECSGSCASCSGECGSDKRKRHSGQQMELAAKKREEELARLVDELSLK